MTTNTKREVLHLDRIPVERDAVKIGDAEYELKALSDLSIIDRAQLNRFGKTIADLEEKEAAGEVEVEDMARMLNRLMHTIFYDDIPAEVQAKLTDAELRSIADFFTERWLLRMPADAVEAIRQGTENQVNQTGD